MGLEHLMLSAMLLVQNVVSVAFMTRDATDARARMPALMQGQAHIAALVAEVLRRTPAP
jgi:hypothetical protein